MRDATRSLMLAINCIRRTGLKVRMPQEPLAFLSGINALCGTSHKVCAGNATVQGR